MNVADEEEFTPDKFRANLERLYMTIVSPRNMSICHKQSNRVRSSA
jgi:hypothetical protein